MTEHPEPKTPVITLNSISDVTRAIEITQQGGGCGVQLGEGAHPNLMTECHDRFVVQQMEFPRTRAETMLKHLGPRNRAGRRAARSNR